MNILALAYVFPPDAGSGTYRSLYFFNHLASLGEKLTVVTVKEEDFAPSANIDLELKFKVDTRINVIRASVIRPMERLLKIRNSIRGLKKSQTFHTKKLSTDSPRANYSLVQCLKDMITNALTCPDEHVGWIPDTFRKSSQVIRSSPIDCIYVTGGPWSALVAGALLKRKHKIPLVLDFRDPWTSNPDIKNRSRLTKICNCTLESFCIKTADYIIANTEELREDFVRRYPSISNDKCITITNGFESINLKNERPRNQKFTLVHAGELYLSRNPASFFKAILSLLREKKISEWEILIKFVGGYSANEELTTLLQTEELKNVIEIIPRVPHGIAIQYQMAADALLIFQTGFPLQIPRKLYEYMSILKPVLAITEHTSATARVIEESKVGVIADQSVESIKKSVLYLFKSWKTGTNNTINSDYITKFKNDYLATKLQFVLKKASGSLCG